MKNLKKIIAVVLALALTAVMFAACSKSTDNKADSSTTAASQSSDKAQLIGLLYDKGQDSSKAPIDAAKKYLDSKGIKYKEYTGTTVDEVSLAVDSAIADGVTAIFTPTDNTIMTAELSIYQKLEKAGIPHFTGADSFALNGAFLGYGVDYAKLGSDTADMIYDITVNKKDPATTPVKTFDNGTATINTDVAKALGYNLDDLKTKYAPYCDEIKEIQTSKEFTDPNASNPASKRESGTVGAANATQSFKIGICNYVDDASLNQIVSNIKVQLDTLGKKNNIKFEIEYQNCNADSNVMNQIISNFQTDKVDLMVGVATPVAMAMQAATEKTKTPVVFAAVSDPEGAKLVKSNDAPGSNITGTSDYLDTDAIFNLILAK